LLASTTPAAPHRAARVTAVHDVHPKKLLKNYYTNIKILKNGELYFCETNNYIFTRGSMHRFYSDDRLHNNYNAAETD
jgi:ABC-type phosphate/phosphonate transport system ATPase subunit